MPEQNYSDNVSLPKVVVRFYKTKLLAQFLLFVLALVALYIPFHHYLPSYRDVWYGLRPSDKELTFENSDQMLFVDEKTGKFLIWYETRPDGYRFYDGPGFYGTGKEREQADTDEKIQMLKQWVDRNAAKKKQEHEQSSQQQQQQEQQQSQATIQDLTAQIVKLGQTEKALQDKVALQESGIADLEKQNKELASQAVKQNTAPIPEPAPTQDAVASDSVSAPPVEVITDPAFYKHGAIIPPNPKPLAWFQSLRWGKLPPRPYIYNAGNGFFEIPGQPDTRIAPHPHFVVKNNKTGLYDRPFVFFIRIHGQLPPEVKIPPLDDNYYRAVTQGLGATFGYEYPYKVTLGGVEY